MFLAKPQFELTITKWLIFNHNFSYAKYHVYLFLLDYILHVKDVTYKRDQTCENYLLNAISTLTMIQYKYFCTCMAPSVQRLDSITIYINKMQLKKKRKTRKLD